MRATPAPEATYTVTMTVVTRTPPGHSDDVWTRVVKDSVVDVIEGNARGIVLDFNATRQENR